MLQNLIYFIPALMIFFHVIDDFYLAPGTLSKLKQKSFWKNPKNYPEHMTGVNSNKMIKYNLDWLPALLIHSFSWAFMIHLPIIYFFGSISTATTIMASIVINMMIHAIIDHLKANVEVIPLTVDQSLHFIQILVTYFIITMQPWYIII